MKEGGRNGVQRGEGGPEVDLGVSFAFTPDGATNPAVETLLGLSKGIPADYGHVFC